MQACIPNDSQPWSSILGSDGCDLSRSACNAFKKSNDVYFHNNFLIKSLLRHLIKSQSFSIGIIKRSLSRYFLLQGITNHRPIPAPKPSALNVLEMFDIQLFRSGSIALDPSSYYLQPDMMGFFHISSCAHCLPFMAVRPDCYFFRMLRCITHGWHIPCDYDAIVPLYKVSGNYPAVGLYSDHVSKELDKMCATKVLHPIAPGSVRFNTPINAVLKNSDKNRARTIAGIIIKDQASLTRASDILVSQGLAKIKIRLTTDHTATGLNSRSYSPAFSYPSIADALRHVTQGCFMCVADIERYFHSYPTAHDDRGSFCIQYQGVSWCYSKCCFGHTACPYYTSTFGAEYHRWFTHVYRIPNSYIVDDWFTAAATLARCLSQMRTISNVFESCGFTMNAAKFKYGQQIVFLGILIDSISMTVRFDPISAKSFRIELEVYLAILLADKHLAIQDIRPICGKLNWFAELVQSGRMHIMSCWNYLRFYKSSYPASMNILRSDLQWWIALLSEWEKDTFTPLVYKILSADSLAKDPHSVYIVLTCIIRRFIMSRSDGMDRLKIHATRCASSFGPYLIFWIQHQYETMSSFG